MKKTLLLLAVFVISSYSYSQCTVNAIATQYDITCGEYVTLSHFGSTSGNVSFSENFNNSQATGWAFTQQATFTNPCSPGGVDGTPHIWMGDQSGVPRTLETLSLNFGPAVAPAGGTICFDLLFAEQGDASPCEGPDESDEGVYLQYSIDNGATWVTIHYFDPNGGNDPQLVNWNNWCFPIPAAALINGVKFRWFQDADSGAAYDHWGIDNVQIIVNDPNVTYTWSHDGYTTSLPGDNPTAVNPHVTTTYTVTMTTSSGTCTQDVTINVVLPVLEVNAGPDLSVCPGQCVDLQGIAKVVNEPAMTKTFSNSQTEDFTAGVLGGGSVNVNIQDLNMNTVNPGSMTQVCITNLTFTGFNAPPSGVETLSLTLECPGGATVVLVPVGGAPTGPPGAFPPLTNQASYYQNVCFVPSGGATLSSVLPANAAPITGTFNSNQPFSNLDGCLANGTWSINVTSTALTGNGTFDGWSITFNDVEDSYIPDVTWSPTTFMTAGEETTPTPTVCPTTTTVYTISAVDTAGCLSPLTDQVTVTADPNLCCALVFDDVQTQNADCGVSNGSITVTVSGQTSGLVYSIDGGVTTQAMNTFTNLPAGQYVVYINDDSNCSSTQNVTITGGNAPSITNVATIQPTCGNSNGSITITASGGTAPLSYSIDNGTTSQAGNAFISLTAGTFTILVEDASGCSTTQTATLTTPNSPTISNIAQTAPTCGANDGTIVISVTGGVAPLTYSVNNGTSSQASGTFNNLGSGTYPVLVTDANGCTATQNVNLSNTSGPSITSTTNVDPSCGGSNGSITINATGGSAPLSYSIDNGTTSQANALFNNLSANIYNIVVEDANGCTAIETVTLTAGSGPTITSVTPTAANCGGADGALTVIATGGTSPLSYSIDNGTTSQPNGTFSSLSAGTYPVLVEDANGCQVTGSGTITTTANPTINAGVDQTICEGDVVTLTGSGGVSYVWDNGVTNATAFTPTTSGTYTVTGTDANGCSNTDQVTITVVPNPTASFTADPMTGYSPLVVTFTNTSSNASGYVWTFGNGTTPVTTTSDDDQTSSYINQGVYTVTLVATNGNCTDSFSLPITVDSLPPAIVHIPNVFTPNNDGSNDAFYIDVLHGKTIHVLIFNRWGNQMFEINDFKTKWDGADASEGVYFFTYEIEGVSGEILKGHGHVSLLRK